jgi:hypothetical protein
MGRLIGRMRVLIGGFGGVLITIAGLIGWD